MTLILMAGLMFLIGLAVGLTTTTPDPTSTTILLKRVCSATSVIASCLLFACMGASAESPHWLVLRGEMHRAYMSLCRLRKTELQAGRDLYMIYIRTIPEQRNHGKTGFTTRFHQVVTLPKIRRAFLPFIVISVYISIAAMQMTPNQDVQHIIHSSLFPPILMLLGIICFIILQFGLKLFAAYAIEAYGRRGLLMRAMPHILWPLMLLEVAGVLLSPQGYYIVKTLFQGSTAMLVLSFATYVPLTYASEAFPLSHRGRCYFSLLPFLIKVWLTLAEIGMAMTMSTIQANSFLVEFMSSSSWKSVFLHPSVMG